MIQNNNLPHFEICAIIGKNLEHSLSPKMHNKAFQELELDYVYLKFEIDETELRTTILKMRDRNYRGYNVTIPYKCLVVDEVDKLDVVAKEIGAVNTIVNDEGMIVGYNTDAYGVLESLKDHGVKLESKQSKVLVLGAGGGARAAGHALTKYSKEIFIANRTFEHGVALAKDLKKNTHAKAINIDEIADLKDKVDILINCTPVGTMDENEKPLIPNNWLNGNMVVFDMVYNPKETGLLKEAGKVGATVVYGYEMLVHQGAKAFELWTCEKAPVQVMRNTILNELDSM
jgi:shikimate dehydrogenase